MNLTETERARLLEVTHDAIIVRDLDGTIRYWNRGAEEVYGWPATEATGRVSHVLLQTTFPQPQPEIEDLLVRTGRWEGELRHRRFDGREVIVESRWVFLDCGSQRVLELNTDITARKEAEERARRHDRRLQLALAAAQFGVFEFDLVSGRVTWSAECHRIFGVERFDGTPEAVLSYVAPVDRERLLAVTPEVFEEGEPVRLEFRIVRPDGEVRWLFNLIELVRDQDGRPVKQIGVVGDITGNRQDQEALRGLTTRERDVLRLIAESKSSREIAVILGISPKTAETHRTNLMRKLDLHSVGALVRFAVRSRLVEA